MGGFSVRSWARAARYWGDPAARPSLTALSRFAGPVGRRRLTQGAGLHSVCLSGLTLLLLGGAWLPRGGGAGAEHPVAFALVLAGLVVFVVGCLGQIWLVFLGRPRFVVPKHARNDDGDPAGGPRSSARGSSVVRGDAVSAVQPRGHKGAAEVLVFRDEADSYARLRRYRVFVDGERVGDLRRGSTA